MIRLKLSFHTKVYHFYPLEKALSNIASLNYDGVEIWGGRPHLFAKDISRLERKKIRELCVSLGLEISSLSPSHIQAPSLNLASSNDNYRTEGIDYVKKCVDCAYDLETSKVHIGLGRTLNGELRENGFKRAAESFAECLDYAEDLGIKLAVEPAPLVDTNIICTLEDVKKLTEIVGKRFYIAFDIGHTNVTKESPVKFIEMLKDRIVHVHVDDNNGDSDSHLIPGKGSIPIYTVIDALKKAGYDDYLSVELSECYDLDPNSAASESRELLRKILSKLS